MKVGMEVKVGSKYAQKCHYGHIVERKGKITRIYVKQNPYRLDGLHTFCLVEVRPDDDWEVHIEDCFPVIHSNKDGKMLLAKYDD